jgi:predicted small metal-binding protein
MPECAFTITAATEAEVLEHVRMHAAHTHGVTEIPAELAAQVKAAIKDQPDVR